MIPFFLRFSHVTSSTYTQRGIVVQAIEAEVSKRNLVQIHGEGRTYLISPRFFSNVEGEVTGMTFSKVEVFVLYPYLSTPAAPCMFRQTQ